MEYGTARSATAGHCLLSTECAPVCCAPQIFRTPLRSLLFQAIFMMQSAENSRRFDDVTRGELVPIGAGRNLCLGGLRNSRSERRMWTAPIVVNDKLRDKPLQVPLAKWKRPSGSVTFTFSPLAADDFVDTEPHDHGHALTDKIEAAIQ